ncbi:MAG: hypothetical protein JJV89_03365 [Desulfosarcina sp.]|nr:hypothetical protein [Desulfobacterales bacterium]
MKTELIILMLKSLYQAGLRNLIIKAIDDPEEVWDDSVLTLLDALLGKK